MNANKIVPCLWFHTENGSLAKLIEYYKAVFEGNFQEGPIIPLGNTPSGNTEMCEVIIFEKKYSFMSTATEHHSFNDALAFAIHCADQIEIDRYWNYFTKEGQEVQCGWCMDKFGLRWQVLPENLSSLMSSPNAFDIMMKQKKIIIEEYLK